MLIRQTMKEIMREVREKGFYRLSLISTDKEKKAIFKLCDQEILTIQRAEPTYIDFMRNWK